MFACDRLQSLFLFFLLGVRCWDDEIASDQGITVYDAVMMQQKKKKKKVFQGEMQKAVYHSWGRGAAPDRAH